MDRVDPASQAELNRHYKELAGRYLHVEGEDAFASLVTPKGNRDMPFHRWFHVKEAFSHLLLQTVVSHFTWRSPDSRLTFVDPFAGSGTSVNSAIDLFGNGAHGVSILGVERNPVLAAVANAKAFGRLHAHNRIEEIEHAATTALAAARGSRFRVGSMPPSATLNNTEYFLPAATKRLVAMREYIDQSCSDPDIRNLLLACLAASVEPASRLRRDGRALRFEPHKTPLDPCSVFTAKVKEAVKDIGRSTPATNAQASIVLGDARRISEYAVELGDADWLVFSPPYPNNIDYTEVYKVEGWVLGYYKDSDDFRRQRLRTLRSHPSLTFEPSYGVASALNLPKDLYDVVQPIVDVLPNNRYTRGRYEMIVGYVEDMYCVFEQLRRVGRRDSRMAFVVGNSHHAKSDAGFVIASDLLLAACAEAAGWSVDMIVPARRPLRRDNGADFLRESVVSLTAV